MSSPWQNRNASEARGLLQMKVAIVDDQASARILIAGIIRGIHPDIQVFDFFEPEEALVWCEANSPSIVIIDYRMPFLDGVTFTQRLKASPGGDRTVVIMVSSQDDSSIRAAAFNAGVVSYFKKPITTELQLQVRNLLAALVAQRVGPLPDVVPAATADTDVSLAALRQLMSQVRLSNPAMEHLIVGVEVVSTAIARQLGLGDAEVASLARAAAVYDIGLLGVPAEIIGQAEPLGAEQRASIEMAPEFGYRVLKEVDAGVANTIRHSHEHFNGSGYPDGLVGDNIPLHSRILAVAGSYCALTSTRPHRGAFRLSEALSLLQQHTGSHYDPAVVGALLDVQSKVHGNLVSMPSRAVLPTSRAASSGAG